MNPELMMMLPQLLSIGGGMFNSMNTPKPPKPQSPEVYGYLTGGPGAHMYNPNPANMASYEGQMASRNSQNQGIGAGLGELQTIWPQLMKMFGMGNASNGAGFGQPNIFNSYGGGSGSFGMPNITNFGG